MTFENSWDEYNHLRTKCGFEGMGMVLKVWANCTVDSQENMLEQLRVAALQHHQQLERINRYSVKHGEVW